jgi:hypothetical protein
LSDISELFARDPLSLTREDRSEIIAHFRDNRARYIAGQAQAKLPKEKAPKAPKAPLPALDDLDL